MPDGIMPKDPKAIVGRHLYEGFVSPFLRFLFAAGLELCTIGADAGSHTMGDGEAAAIAPVFIGCSRAPCCI